MKLHRLLILHLILIEKKWSNSLVYLNLACHSFSFNPSNWCHHLKGKWAVTLKMMQPSKPTSRFTPSFWERLPTETLLCWRELKLSSVCWSSLHLVAVDRVAVLSPDLKLSQRTVLSVPSHPGAVLSTRCWDLLNIRRCHLIRSTVGTRFPWQAEDVGWFGFFL